MVQMRWMIPEIAPCSEGCWIESRARPKTAHRPSEYETHDGSIHWIEPSWLMERDVEPPTS